MDSHEPGMVDVSTTEPGLSFWARPNFHFFKECGRPCWLPFYPSAKLVKGMAVTKNWPCEQYGPHDRSRGEACHDSEWRDGDWIAVIGQLRGQSIRNEQLEESDIWDVVAIEAQRMVRQARSMLEAVLDGSHYVAYAPDLWLGNTGWHDIPWRPWQPDRELVLPLGSPPVGR